MLLTDEEKDMLEGGQGDIKRRCMEFLAAYGEAAGAERLVDLDGTVDMHPGTFWVRDYSFAPEEIEALAKKGEKFKVPTFANKATQPGFIFDGWEDCGTLPDSDPEYHKKCYEPFKYWIQMGMIPTFSCNSYLVASYLPTVGQHCAWVESSAIPWVNAVLGARSNFDGCFQTAYLGKVPAYDMHLDENRIATVLVECEAEIKRNMDFDLLGWAVGEECSLDVPAITGIGKPTTSQLVKMNSALNTGGNVRMYHIPGVTPEAPTLEAAFKGRKPQRKVTITAKDLKMRGITLGELMLKHERLTTLGGGRLLARACLFLQTAHDNGLLHRDLTPANIMIVDVDTQFESIKVMDFGLARRIGFYIPSGQLNNQSSAIDGGTPTTSAPNKLPADRSITAAISLASACFCTAC